MASKNLVEVSGSEKEPLEGARAIAPAPPDERLELTVRVRPRNQLPDASDMLKPAAGPAPHLTHAEYERLYGADPKDLARVRKFAEDHGLAVVRESAARRSVMLSGTVAAFKTAFGVDLHVYEHPGGTYRGRVGYVHVPEDLAPVVEGVFGLDNRPVAKPHFRIHRHSAPHTAAARAFNPTR